MKIVKIYVHSDKESAYDAAVKAGIVGEEQLHMASFLGYEHKLTFEVDETTGEGVLVAVDDRQFPPSEIPDWRPVMLALVRRVQQLENPLNVVSGEQLEALKLLEDR